MRVKRRQLAGPKTLRYQISLHFAAGSFGHRVRWKEHDRAWSNSVVPSHGRPDILHDFCVASLRRRAVNLLTHDYSLIAVAGNPEDRSTSRPHRPVAAEDFFLNVVGIEIASTVDDEVFAPARDEQLSIENESQVPGSKVWHRRL